MERMKPPRVLPRLEQPGAQHRERVVEKQQKEEYGYEARGVADNILRKIETTENMLSGRRASRLTEPLKKPADGDRQRSKAPVKNNLKDGTSGTDTDAVPASTSKSTFRIVQTTYAALKPRKTPVTSIMIRQDPSQTQPIESGHRYSGSRKQTEHIPDLAIHKKEVFKNQNQDLKSLDDSKPYLESRSNKQPQGTTKVS